VEVGWYRPEDWVPTLLKEVTFYMPELLTTPLAELDVVYGTAVPDDAALMRLLRGQNWMDYVGVEDADWMASQVVKFCGPEGVEKEVARIHSANTDPHANSYFQTAKVDGKLAGYISGFREHEAAPGELQAIAGLHVVPACIGRGIGSRLLEKFFQDIGQAKPTVLDTIAGTPAVGFYRKHGFEEWPEHDESWGPLRVIKMKKEKL
jgi:ribosomal protein S18 acetylase RimI-like enzyme